MTLCRNIKSRGSLGLFYEECLMRNAILAALGAAVVVLMMSVTGGAQAPAAAAQREFKSPEVLTHINNAYLLAGKDLSPTYIPSLFIVPRRGLGAPAMVAPSPSLGGAARVPPTKMFDQLYYVGSSTLGSYALRTSDGIILIDTMNNAMDAEQIIEPGMRTLGLDPAQIKFILITHGHGDHYGGAKYFQDKYGSKVMMGGPDWAQLEAARGRAAAAGRQGGGGGGNAPPTRDLDIADGQKLVLGDTTVALYLSPGHTPGSMSAIFPVTDGGQRHVVSLFGGTGLPTTRAGLETYLGSVERLIRAGINATADVAISTHPIFDGTDDKALALAANPRRPGTPNPWVLGHSGYLRYMMVNLEVAQTVRAMMIEAGVQ
jgi:metallo-beta-lactamase class B